VGYTYTGEPVTAGDLKVAGAMAMLLKDAIKPNLVQTLENVPAFVHGGPFANIAHGCNSLIATKLGLKLVDYLITEAGFGADLGAEKFFNIKCRYGSLNPDAAVIVASVRALKLHGGERKDRLTQPNLKALQRGLANLEKHLENVSSFGVPAVVAVNRFPSDTQEELQLVIDRCSQLGVRACVSEVWAKGGEGGLELAENILQVLKEQKSSFRLLYQDNMSIKDKINTIVTRIYGGKRVAYTRQAEEAIDRLQAQGYSKLPICMAKTQYSLSDDPNLLGRPDDFTVTVRDVRVSAGAGFIVVLTGDVMTMPGLPKKPAAENMDIDEEGRIRGLF
jgi:formate--tetrahydrofolate ligase